MANGFFLGGMAQGMQDQQKLGIAQQAQDNIEKQQTIENVQKQITATMTAATDTVKAITEAGKDPKEATNVISPLIESAASLAQRIYGADGANRIRQQGQMLLARPPESQDGNHTAHIVTDPNNPLQQNIVVLDKNTGQPKIFGPTGQPMSSAAPTPSIVPPGGGVNLTGPGKTITGVDVQDMPPVAPAQPAISSGQPTQMTQAQPTAQPSTPTPPGLLNSDSIDFRAKQLNLGNADALKGLPRSKLGMIQLNAITNRAVELAKEEGLNPAEANARIQEYKATTAGAQVLGKRDAGLVGGIAIVTATAPIVAELSSKIDRTNYPLINSIIMAGKQQTGDPDVVRLGIALNTLTNGYARAQGGGNSVLTDTAREEARHLLQLAYSDGQLKAGVDQLIIEMQREKYEVGHAMTDYLKLKRSNAPPPVDNHIFITPGGSKFKVIQ